VKAWVRRIEERRALWAGQQETLGKRFAAAVDALAACVGEMSTAPEMRRKAVQESEDDFMEIARLYQPVALVRPAVEMLPPPSDIRPAVRKLYMLLPELEKQGFRLGLT
jgi:hypothetical protein